MQTNFTSRNNASLKQKKPEVAPQQDESIDFIMQRAKAHFPSMDKQKMDIQNSHCSDINHLIEKLVCQIPTPNNSYELANALIQMRTIADEQEKTIQKNMIREQTRETFQQEIDHYQDELEEKHIQPQINIIPQSSIRDQSNSIPLNFAKPAINNNRQNKTEKIQFDASSLMNDELQAKIDNQPQNENNYNFLQNDPTDFNMGLFRDDKAGKNITGNNYFDDDFPMYKFIDPISSKQLEMTDHYFNHSVEDNNLCNFMN